MSTISSPVRGALWMSVAVVSFCAMAIASRELMRHMGTFEVLFFRTGVSLVLLLALVPRIGIATLRTAQLGVQVWRNLFHFGGQAAWVYSLSVLPLALVFAIEFTIPVWTAALAAVFLGERMNGARIVMLALGLIGVLIILRPGVGVIQPAALIMLLGAVGFSVQMIGTKKLSRTDSPYAVLFWMSVIQSPICLVAAWPHWVMPQASDMPWILIIGCGNFAAHYCLTRAMKLADASVVVPIDFFRLPLIALIGAWAYGEPLDPMIMVGAAIIFVGTYLSLLQESKRKI
jgi:drug/metabolite transporter (DMT)-like permease